jgi:hypothetical protein
MIESTVGTAEHGTDMMQFTKGGAFLYQTMGYWLLPNVVFGLAVGLAG